MTLYIPKIKTFAQQRPFLWVNSPCSLLLSPSVPHLFRLIGLVQLKSFSEIPPAGVPVKSTTSPLISLNLPLPHAVYLVAVILPPKCFNRRSH